MDILAVMEQFGVPVAIFYLEAKQVHTGNSNERVRPRLQTIGRYYSKTNRSTKEGTDGTAKA